MGSGVPTGEQARREDVATPADGRTPEPYLQDADVTLYHGDVLATLRELPAESVDCVVTSPPYWGLRDYGIPDQLGLEPTPEQYVERMVEVFREVRRVLAAHGTVWLNLGDSYASNWPCNRRSVIGAGSLENGKREARPPRMSDGLKEKDLVGVPWRVAFALQADGWYLRSDIIWSKPNPMPESVTDRPTKAHEYVFLLSKQARYFFDQEAVRESHAPGSFEHHARYHSGDGFGYHNKNGEHGMGKGHTGLGALPNGPNPAGRNIRSVWEIATQPYPEAHFATFPEELARRCIAAGCPEQVCRVCGKARERVLERMEVKASYGETRGRYSNDEGILSASTKGIGKSRQYYRSLGMEGPPPPETLGFTDCGCLLSERGNGRNFDGPAQASRSSAPRSESKYRPGVVLDPFIGSGTVAYVARKLGRHAIGIDLSAEYLQLAARRLQQQSLFAEAR